MAPDRLKNTVVLVTGSSTGIGQGIVERAAREGASVMVHGLEPELCTHVVRTIAEEGGAASFIVGDLIDPTVPQKLVHETVRVYGRLDAIVNNAGISTRADLASTSPLLFDQVMAVNARAPMLMCQAAAPYLTESPSGRIINIGSINATSGGSKLLAYSMAKGALMTMTRNLSVALAPKVRVNQLNIGWTLTPNEYELVKSDGMPEDWPSQLGVSTIPFGRMLTPEDIAAAVCFFLSPETDLISGSVIEYDQQNRFGILGGIRHV